MHSLRLQSFPFAAAPEMSSIDPTAVVSGKAEIDPSVVIGPFAVIEDNVQIAAGSTIGPHAVIREFCRVGKNNTIDAHAVIGGHPQHTNFDGSETWVEIGDNNVIREGVTIHRAYEPGAVTKIGSDCFLMSYAHVGHDSIVGNNVMLSNNIVLGGHVVVGDSVVMGGCAGAHQFLRIGILTDVAGATAGEKLFGERATDIHRQTDDLALGIRGQDAAGRLKASDPGHIEVHQDDVECGPLGDVPRFFSTLRFSGDLETFDRVELR